MFKCLLPLLLLGCHQGDPADTAAPCESETTRSWISTIVPSRAVESIEVGSPTEWKVVAQGDCIDPYDGDDLCPMWDFSDDHVIRDGHLVTLGTEDEDLEVVLNGTDRDWTVMWR